MRCWCRRRRGRRRRGSERARFPRPARDQPGAALVGEVHPQPAHRHERPVLEAGQQVEIESIYPNPTANVVTLKFHLPQAEKVTCRVVDISGKTVLTWPAERLAAGEQSRTLRLNALPAGSYALVLETNGGRMGKLIVKE